MAMEVGGRRGGAISSINVTPMADVIIVLLIIFMVTVPVITRQVDLPDAMQSHVRKEGPIVVTIRRDGSISLSDHGVVVPFELADRIRERRAGGDGVVQLSADQSLAYERVAEVLAACREAGADQIAIMTEEGEPPS